MQTVGKKKQKELERIKKLVEGSYQYFSDNYKTFYEFTKFFFQSNIEPDERDALNALGKPVIEFNFGEAYCSRLIGEWSKQEPSVEVGAREGTKANTSTIKLVEDHLRYQIREANNNGMAMEVYKDQCRGGFSVIKLWTDYEDPLALHQVIKFGRVFDPTLCGFDPLARQPHKGDGKYCFEIFPMRREDFEAKHPKINLDDLSFTKGIGLENTALFDFNWSYKNDKLEDILLVCRYFEKRYKNTEVVQLSNYQTMTIDDYESFIQDWKEKGYIAEPPIIISRRKTTLEVIDMYLIIENNIIEYKETDYPGLPYIFVDGNSVIIRNSTNGATSQITKPYLYNLRGLQKLKNFAGQTLANELENMVQHKFVVSQQSLPTQEAFLAAYTNVQKARVMVYNEFLNNNPDQRTTPPREIQRPPIPSEVINTFTLCDSMSQVILGSYDASLGVSDNQLSGVAIVEGATNSNAAAMPYVVGYMQAWNQLSQMYVKMIPKYWVTPMSVPIMGKDNKRNYMVINDPNNPQSISLDYEPNSLNVKVEASVSFAIQKHRALQQIIALTQASPIFAQFINTVGLPILLDNLEINGVDYLKELSTNFQQQILLQQQQQLQMQQQSMRNNPAMAKVQLESAKLQHAINQDQKENMMRLMELEIDQANVRNDSAKIAMDAKSSHDQSMTQLVKSNTERMGQVADVAMRAMDMDHKHKKETVELAHKIVSSSRKKEPNETNE